MPDEENLAHLVLHRYTSVSGKIRIPSDRGSIDGIIAILDGTRNELVKADGSFSFASVCPGKHRISATGVGLINKSDVDFELEENGSYPSSLVIELERMGCIAFSCGSAFAGAKISLRPAEESRDIELDEKFSKFEMADASGRVEFTDVKPGKYFLQNNYTKTVFDFEDKSNQSEGVEIFPNAGPFEVKEMTSTTRVSEMNPVQVTFPDGTCSIRGKLNFPSLAWNAQLHLFLKGEESSAYTDFRIEKYSQWFASEPMGHFEIHQLPAGDYKLFATVKAISYGKSFSFSEDNHPTELAAFSIKKGEKLVLNDIPFVPDLKKTVFEALIRASDKPAEFNP